MNKLGKNLLIDWKIFLIQLIEPLLMIIVFCKTFHIADCESSTIYSEICGHFFLLFAEKNNLQMLLIYAHKHSSFDKV